MKSLSIDHGSARSGFALFEDGKYLESGFIEFSKPLPDVLLEYYYWVRELIEQYEPGILIIEKQVQVVNVKSTAVLFKLNGITELIAVQEDLRFIEMEAVKWRSVLGLTRADKVEIALYLSSEIEGVDYKKICVPVICKRASKKHKIGDALDYKCDESDAIAMNLAYWRSR